MYSMSQFRMPGGPDGKAKLARNLADLMWTFGIKRYESTGRCEHGKSRAQHCTDCEGGYVHSTWTHFEPRVEPGAAVESDDGESVRYLPREFRSEGRTMRLYWSPEREEYYVAEGDPHHKWLSERGVLTAHLPYEGGY